MNKVVESHKYFLTCAICMLATFFFLKVGFEAIHQKGIEPKFYTGQRLK